MGVAPQPSLKGAMGSVGPTPITPPHLWDSAIRVHPSCTGLLMEPLTPTPATSYSPQSATSPGTLVALVVDTDATVRRAASCALSHAGYRVYDAADAEAALLVLKLREGHIDLVLTDVVMPRFDGVRLGREVTRRWLVPRVLYMSGHPARVLEAYGLDLVRTPFIHKPFTGDFLLKKVAELLETRPIRASGAVRQGRAGRMPAPRRAAHAGRAPLAPRSAAAPPG
jgi:CheY-like chemotaxis protein